MTIIRRNRLIRRIAENIADQHGREALLSHYADVDDRPEGRHGMRCCESVREDAARNTYHHLTDRRVYRSPSTGRAHLAIGLPALQRMIGDRA